jgi:hypothetical protein
MREPNGEWLEAIASRGRVDIGAVEAVLTVHHIRPTPVLASPRRLMLEEIHFTGVKDGVADDGPFEFRWENLGHGLWAMLTDKNLRGKSSVIEVVRWLLRGKPSLILQDDVRRWIHKARIRFRLDEVLYEVTLQATANVTGTLLRFNSKGNGVVLAPFASESEFEGVMAQFFMRDLARLSQD